MPLCTPAARYYSGLRSALCIALNAVERIIRRGIVLSPGNEHVSRSRKQAVAAVVVGVSDPQKCITMPAVARKEARRCAVHATFIADTMATGITSRSTRAIAAWTHKTVRDLWRVVHFILV